MVIEYLEYCFGCGHSYGEHELVIGYCPECYTYETQELDDDDNDNDECICIDTSFDNEGFEICNECGKCVS